MSLRLIANLLTIWAVVTALLPAAAVAAQGEGERPASDEQLIADARDGTLDDFALLTAALIASGVNDQSDLVHHAAAYARHAENVQGLVAETAGVDDPAELVLGYLHERILTREYQSTSTEVQRALTDGIFNCVSATVLYQCLCREVDLDPVAVATSQHVRTRFHQGQPVDVETTCADWFAVVRRDPSAQLFRTVYQVTRELTDVQLLGKIYYNRGVSLLEARQYPQAVAVLRRSLELDPHDEAARQNLAAAFSNWVLAECDAGHFSQAGALAAEGLREVPDYEPLLANDLHCHQQWALALCGEARFAEAIEVLESARERRPDVPLFDAGRFAVYRQWAEALLQSDRQDEAWLLFAETRLRYPDHPEAARYEALALHRSIDAFIRNGQWKAAQSLLDRALQRMPHDLALRQQQARLTTQGL